MYSRNMRNNRRGGLPPRVQYKEEITDERINGMPQPPPNYRGMIYDTDVKSDIFAEGIDRIVNNDDSYQSFEKNIGTFTSKPKEVCKDEKNGLHKLIDGLTDKSFGAEDILICAMIILMLNNNSEDDILMVLVLMMLL